MKIRKISLMLVMLVYLLLSTAGVANAKAIKENGVTVEIDSAKEGKVQLIGETEKEKIKIMVAKGNQQTWHDVELVNGKFQKEIWLTEGKGTYTVSVMVNEYEKKYSYGPKVTIENDEAINKYQVPTKHVESNDKAIVSLAQEIIKDKVTDDEKARAIYQWVAQNIHYDYEKYAKHQKSDYNNDYGAITTLQTQKGVCYDYATLTAALGRAAGLQVKVIKGQGISQGFQGLHAWNEIYISEDDKWVKLDTTFAATTGKNNFDNTNFDEKHIKMEEY